MASFLLNYVVLTQTLVNGMEIAAVLYSENVFAHLLAGDNIMLHNKKSQSGFTLVEMMIAIGILAILAAIAYPSYMQYIQRARIEAARAEMADNIRMMEQHYAKKRTMCKSPEDTDKNADGTCKNMPAHIENPAADFYDTRIIADPMSKDSGSYIITSVPNDKARYSDTTLANRELHLLYYSNGSGFVKCTKAGFDKVKAQTTTEGDANDSTGCSVM